MEQLTNNSIIWAAGENSGDYLASRVLPAVAASRPNLKMEGIGGDRMIQDAWILGFMPANFPSELFGSDPPSAANFKNSPRNECAVLSSFALLPTSG